LSHELKITEITACLIFDLSGSNVITFNYAIIVICLTHDSVFKSSKLSLHKRYKQCYTRFHMVPVLLLVTLTTAGVRTV
jgi:hypothetical protein